MESSERESLEQAFRSELESDEKLLWVGRPAQGIKFRLSDIFLTPFSFIWGGFAFFWETTVLLGYFETRNEPDGMPIMFPLWGIPFCIIGLYLVFGRYIHDRIRRERTYYAITNKRVIIVSTMFKTSLNSYYLDKLDTMKLDLNADGSGTLHLEKEDHPFTQTAMLFPGRHQLEEIEDVKEVNKLIQRARQ